MFPRFIFKWGTANLTSKPRKKRWPKQASKQSKMQITTSLPSSFQFDSCQIDFQKTYLRYNSKINSKTDPSKHGSKQASKQNRRRYSREWASVSLVPFFSFFSIHSLGITVRRAVGPVAILSAALRLEELLGACLLPLDVGLVKGCQGVLRRSPWYWSTLDRCLESAVLLAVRRDLRHGRRHE